MKKLLVVLAGLGLWVSILVPVVGAMEEPNRDPYLEMKPFSGPCSSLNTFSSGCNASGGNWSSAYNTFATANGIKAGTGGARVQWFPSSSRSLDQVLYVVGPYLGAQDGATDFDSVNDERRTVGNLAPGMTAVRRAMDVRDVSIVYIGFGKFEDSQIPTAQRVVATKTAIRAFEKQRATSLGRSPESTALIGLSLGGVVGKIALSELEREGFDHGVETYISYDSPHWGAYTPPSLQNVPLYLHGAFRWLETGFSWTEGFAGNDLDDARDEAARITGLTLKNPVAQDLLAYNLAYDGWRSPNISYIRDRYRSLPSTTRNVAVASGSTTGQAPNLADNYFSVRSGKSGNELKFKVEMDTFIPRTGEDPFFWAQTSYKALTGPWYRPEFKRIYYTGAPAPMPAYIVNDYERAPCAHSTEIVDSMVSQINHQLSTTKWSGFSMSATERRACFIPTFSAIIGEANGEGPVTGKTMFDAVIGDGVNKAHLSTSAGMNQAIISELAAVFTGAGAPAEGAPAEGDQIEGGLGDITGVDADDLAAIVEGMNGGGCDFESQNHNLDDTLAMFPDRCGRPWNDQTDRCDYGPDGWHCYEVGNEVIAPPITRPFPDDSARANDDSDDGKAIVDSNPDGALASAAAGEQIAPEPVNEPEPEQEQEQIDEVEDEQSSSGCDFSSGTHNLDDTRAMFPDKCGRDWNAELDKCDYGDDGWRCYQIADD